MVIGSWRFVRSAKGTTCLTSTRQFWNGDGRCWLLEFKTPVPLDELETHLRDEIEQQAKSGVNEAEAFRVAVEKIGSANLVQNEFKKVEPKWADLEWKLTEVLLAVGSILAPLLMSHSVLFHRGSSAMTLSQKMASLAAFVTFALLVWAGRLSYRVFPVIPRKRIRNAISLASFALLGLGFRFFSALSCHATTSP